MSDAMYCISLWEPWSSLIRLKHKTIETRGWPAPYGLIGQRIAIHSSKRTMRGEIPWWLLVSVFGSATPDFPFGRISCTAIVEGCEPTRDVFANHPNRDTRLERHFGDYTDGRYAWLLGDVKPLVTPIPVRGFQRLWRLDPYVMAQIRQQGGL